MGDMVPGPPKEQDNTARRNTKEQVNRNNKEKVKKSSGENSAKKQNGEKAPRKSPNSDKNSARVWFSPTEFKLRQNLPPQLPKRPTDIYLSSNCEGKELVEQQGRAIRLLQEGETVWLHSIGLNIPKCITLVNKLAKDFEKLEVDNFTQTWELSDNWASLEEVGPRYNSGLHVRCRIAQ